MQTDLSSTTRVVNELQRAGSEWLSVPLGPLVNDTRHTPYLAYDRSINYSFTCKREGVQPRSHVATALGHVSHAARAVGHAASGFSHLFGG